MVISPELRALAEYMAGEFNNQAQALADPVWYVHLHLWHRPVPFNLFPEPSLILFAEQANIVNLNQPYRPRFIQLRPSLNPEFPLEAQYYMPQNISQVQGAGQDPERLQHLTPEDLKLLPGCTLNITYQVLSPNHYLGSRFEDSRYTARLTVNKDEKPSNKTRLARHRNS